MLRTRACVVAAVIISIFGATAGIAHAQPVHLRSLAAARPQRTTDFSLARYESPNLGQCLGIDSNNNAIIFTCSYTGHQEYHFGNEKGTSSYYQLINAAGQCLGVSGGSEDAGAQVIGFRCDGNDSQYWNLDFISTTSYVCYVFNYNSSLVLQPNGNTNGALVKQQPWTESNNQKWVFVGASKKSHHK